MAPTNYTYDDEGNLIQRTKTGEVVDYTWDYRNRLTKVEIRPSAGATPSKVIDSTYDANDLRVSKTVTLAGQASVSERYLYDGDDLLTSMDGNGSVTARDYTGTVR